MIEHDPETIVRENIGWMLSLAERLLRDPSLAEDAVQQALLRIWSDIRGLRDPARFEGWSYRLLVRICYAEAKRQPPWTSDENLPEARVPVAADDYDSIAHRDQLERAFARLSVDHRAVVVLHRLRGMPLEQVAEVLEVPVGTVKSRLSRAMEGLRAALEADSRRKPTGSAIQEVV